MGMVIYPTVHVGFNNPHWNLFFPSTQSSYFNTQQKCLFCIIILKPTFFSKPNICVLSWVFFPANLVAPQTASLPPCNAWDSPGISLRQIQIPCGQALHDPGLFGGPRLAWRIGGKRHYHLGNSHIPTLGKGQSMKTIFKIVIYENLYIVFSLNQPTWVILSPTPNNTLFFVKIPKNVLMIVGELPPYESLGNPPKMIPSKWVFVSPFKRGTFETHWTAPSSKWICTANLFSKFCQVWHHNSALHATNIRYIYIFLN